MKYTNSYRFESTGWVQNTEQDFGYEIEFSEEIRKKKNAKTGEIENVSLTSDYYLGVYPVTQRQYVLLTGNDNPSQCVGAKVGTGLDASKTGQHPVESLGYNAIRGSTDWGVNWPTTGRDKVKADSVLDKMRKRTGIAFDLPTDAQWEYVCRAGTTAARYTGVCTDADLNTIARWKNTTAGDNRHPGCHTDVGTYAPNPWGIYDLYGNVWEFTRDYFVDAAHELSPVDPCQAVRPVSGMQDRTVRGGSYGSEANSCRSAFRSYYDQRTSAGGYGYRLVIQL